MKDLTYKSHLICLVIYIMSNVQYTRCETINDTTVLLRDLMDGYNKNVRPVEKQRDPVDVNVSLLLVSIQDLDEIRGILSIMGIMSIQWNDASMVWDPEMYGGENYVMTSYKEVWVPELILINPAEETDSLGKKWQRVFFSSNGYASWWPGDLIKSTCTLNVYKYPFDTQECILTFSVWGYFSGQIHLNPISNELDLSFFTKSSTWTLTGSNVESISSGTQINFTIRLKRKPEFVIVNILLPLTFLSILNAFVFLLLPESGERISYCITVLLSIAVFMTIVSDTLPKSSEPVPVISYKLMVDMVSSALMTLVTILNLRVYNRIDKNDVPYWLKRLYGFLSCKGTKRGDIHPISSGRPDTIANRKQSVFNNDDGAIIRKGSKHNKSSNTSDITKRRMSSISVFNLEEKPVEPVQNTLVRMMSEVEQHITHANEVSWKNISNMLDGIAFVLFTLMSVCSFLVFFVITF